MQAGTFEIRTIGARDVTCFKDMLAMFGKAFEDVDSYQAAVPSDQYISRLLGKEHFIAIAALDGAKVVGGIAAYQLDKFEQDRREIYIYDLAVDDDYRRRGIATAMIRELQRTAAERDVYVIFVQADLVDAPAIALYDKLGTKETAHHFDIPVPQRPE